MTHQITKLASLIIMIAVTAVTSNANADEYAHIDRLAVKIRNSARRITKETIHYRHTPEYRHLVADSNTLYRLATHIHDVTHFEGNLTHLANDLDQLDRTFHHLERVFDRVEHAAAFGNGHVHGRTAHVKRLLNSIEDNIHHIREDVEILRRRLIIVKPPCARVPYGGCGYGGQRNSGYRGYGNNGYDRTGSPGHGGYGFGFSIGGGNSRIQFQF